jgi:hypothetical protein
VFLNTSLYRIPDPDRDFVLYGYGLELQDIFFYRVEVVSMIVDHQHPGFQFERKYCLKTLLVEDAEIVCK